MKMTTDKIIERLQALAEKNYSKGWDTFVECYDRQAWLDFITRDDGSIMTYSYALRLAKDCASVWLERQHDADYYARGEM